MTESREEVVNHRSEECCIDSSGNWNRHASSIVGEPIKRSKASLQPDQQILDDGLRVLSGWHGKTDAYRSTKVERGSVHNGTVPSPSLNSGSDLV